jgi:hypothetical protein
VQAAEVRQPMNARQRVAGRARGAGLIELDGQLRALFLVVLAQILRGG